MWGIRATRVGFLLAAVLATVAATGCCSDCCKKLWGDTAPPVSASPGSPNAPAGATSNKAAGGQLDANVRYMQGKMN